MRRAAAAMIVLLARPVASSADPGAGWLELTPAGGILGERPLFALRGAYTISPRLAIEAEAGHNIGELASAYLHSAGLRAALLRHRGHTAFVTAGFGTFSAAGGDALAAARSVTRSQLRLGGGIRLRLRDDVGVRLDLRHHRILLGGGDTPGADLGTNEISIGLTFARRIGSQPPGRSAP